MKIFINNRNYVTWPSAMAKQFSEEGHEIIFVDNGSTYEPLLDYYSQCKFKVIRLANIGNRAPWDAGIVNNLDEHYVCTDPDYDLSMIPKDWPEVLMEGFKQFPHYHKLGLSWDESKVPPENPAWIADEMYKYPQGHPATWGHPLPNNWWNYPCDSSFAIHKPRIKFDIGGIRKGRPYTGVHLPWHITISPTKDTTKMSVPFDDEIAYYFLTCENSSFTWARMIEFGMLAEYLKITNQTKESLIEKYQYKERTNANSRVS